MPITTKGYLGLGRETTMTLPLSKEVRFNGKAYRQCFLDVEIKEHSPAIYPTQEIISITMRPSFKDEHILSPLIVNYKQTDTYRIQVMDQHLDVLSRRVASLFPECTGWPRFYEEFHEKPTRKHAKGVRLAVKWGNHEIDAGKVTTLIWLDDEAFRSLIQNEIDAYKAMNVYA